jgi:hypothetical protein
LELLGVSLPKLSNLLSLLVLSPLFLPRSLFVSRAMAENSGSNGNYDVALTVKENEANHNHASPASKTNLGGGFCVSYPFMQKVHIFS